MTTIDHINLQVNDLPSSVAFYTATLGFANEGTEGPFIVIRVSPDFQIQLAPWGARGLAPTLYFNDPNKHLLELRWYE